MALPISARKIIQNNEIVFDPDQFIPPDLVGVKASVRQIEDDIAEFSVATGIDDIGTTLRPPQTFEIISQTIRQNAAGVSVVDVIIDAEDVPGAGGYELRVTKV